MPAGSDSDRGGDRFERGLYVGLAAAAAAAGMTTAAYLTFQRFNRSLREDDVEWRMQALRRVAENIKSNQTIASEPTPVGGGLAGSGKPPTIASVPAPVGGGIAGLKRNPLVPFSWDGT